MAGVAAPLRPHPWTAYHHRRQDASIPSQPSPDDASPRGEPAGRRTLGLGGWLIELVLPVTVSAALLLALAAYTSRWDLHTTVGLAVFGALLVVLSLFLSLRVDALTLARRRRNGKRQLLNRADARSRLVKFVLGGLVIPIAALTAANRVELPNHQTPMAVMSTAFRSRLAWPAASRAEQLGNAVLRARSPAAKVQGILALQSLASGDALEQLLRILTDDPTALTNDSQYQALSVALASYGTPAEAKLRQSLDGVSPGARASAPAPPGDAFEREVAGGSEAVPSPDRLPSFVMRTFLQMGLKEDADLLAFARQTAADEGWSEAVRGQALLLTAKLGGKEDLDLLYAYLESPSPVLQAHAMRAIAELQSRLSDAATKG
jgi:hypothetical protein